MKFACCETVLQRGPFTLRGCDTAKRPLVRHEAGRAEAVPGIEMLGSPSYEKAREPNRPLKDCLIEGFQKELLQDNLNLYIYIVYNRT
jgi:hypothetical protein